MFPRVKASSTADEDALSFAWGRQFQRVMAVQRRSNTIIELEEQNADRPMRRFLRLARFPGWSEVEIAWELSLLRSVPAGLSTGLARPLPGADGQYLRQQDWSGERRYACLFEAAPGRDLKESEDDLSRFGRALAKLQAAMSGFKEPAPPGRCIDVAEICRTTSQWLVPHGAAAAALAADIRTTAPMLEEAFARSYLPSDPCHGDAHIQNAKLDGERITFFDFDECVIGPLALDLVAMAAWLEPEPNGKELWRSLVQGYTEHRPLTPDELASLPMLALLSELRNTHNLARFCTMAEDLWAEMRARVGRRISDFCRVREPPDAPQQLP